MSKAHSLLRWFCVSEIVSPIIPSASAPVRIKPSRTIAHAAKAPPVPSRVRFSIANLGFTCMEEQRLGLWSLTWHTRFLEVMLSIVVQCCGCFNWLYYSFCNHEMPTTALNSVRAITYCSPKRSATTETTLLRTVHVETVDRIYMPNSSTKCSVSIPHMTQVDGLSPVPQVASRRSGHHTCHRAASWALHRVLVVHTNSSKARPWTATVWLSRVAMTSMKQTVICNSSLVSLDQNLDCYGFQHMVKTEGQCVTSQFLHKEQLLRGAYPQRKPSQGRFEAPPGLPP